MARYSPLLNHKNFHKFFENKVSNLNLKFEAIVERQLGVHDLLKILNNLKRRMSDNDNYTREWSKDKIDGHKMTVTELEDRLLEGVVELANARRDLKEKSIMTDERYEEVKNKYTSLLPGELHNKYTHAIEELEKWMASTNLDPKKDDGTYYMESYAFPGKYLKIAGDFSNLWNTPEIVPWSTPVTVNINASTEEPGRRRIWKRVDGHNIYVWFDRQGDIESINQPNRDRAQLHFIQHSDGSYSIQWGNSYLCMNDHKTTQRPHMLSHEKFWIYQ